MRLLLIEDDLNIASFIKKGLQEDGFAVDHSVDGEEGLHLALTIPYDIAVIDLMLPKKDGLSVIKSIRASKQNTPIIILSAKSKIDDRVEGLHTGGDDYLTKPFAFSELLARIHALLRRANGLSEPTVISVCDLSVDLLSREVVRDGKKIELLPLEYALLEYLIRNKNRVVSKTMIIEHVWDYNFDPQTNIVESKICMLREKIDRNFNRRLIKTIRGVGYVIRDDDSNGMMS